MLYNFSYTSGILAFIASFGLSLVFTFLIKKVALKFKILDYPSEQRKIHKKPKPLLGGIAVFLSFILVLLFFTFFTNDLAVRTINNKQIIGILLGGLILMIGGFLDDKYNLKPLKQFIWPFLAVLIVIIFGVGIKYIGNPLGEGLLYLDQIKLEILRWKNVPYYFTFWSDIFSFIWILGMIYTTKYLDGLDGLVAGESVIAGIILFFLSLSAIVHQPETALLSIIVVGVFLGFLILNFYPAKIFLGEGGSTFAGFIIAVLAIIAGAKIAITLLIMGIPILDALWVIIRRIFWEKKSPFTGDKKHLHFRLLGLGLSHKRTVLFLYCISFIFGACGLFLQTKEKFMILLTLTGFMVILGFVLVKMNFKLKN